MQIKDNEIKEILITRFLAFAGRLTKTPAEQIEVIWCEENPDGKMDGCIEIDGRREYIRENCC